MDKHISINESLPNQDISPIVPRKELTVKLDQERTPPAPYALDRFQSVITQTRLLREQALHSLLPETSQSNPDLTTTAEVPSNQSNQQIKDHKHHEQGSILTKLRSILRKKQDITDGIPVPDTQNQRDQEENDAISAESPMVEEDVTTALESLPRAFADVISSFPHDPQIQQAVREHYFDSVITPQLEQLIYARALPVDVVSVKSLLREVIQTSTLEEAKKDEIAQRYRELTSDLIDQQILNHMITFRENEENLLQLFAVSLGRHELQNLDTQFNSALDDYEKYKDMSWEKFQSLQNIIFNLATESHIENSEGEQIDLTLESYVPTFDLSVAYLKAWHAIKSTPSLSELSPKATEDVDDLFSHKVIQHACTRGETEWVDMLAMTPTPDAVRALLLLTASDSKIRTIGYRNNALHTLTKRDDWQDVFNRAKEGHPELSSLTEDKIRYLLLSEPGLRVGENFEFEDMMRDVALKTIADKSSPLSLVDTAVTCLPTEDMVTYYQNLDLLKIPGEEVISPEDARILQKTVTLMRRLHTEYVFDPTKESRVRITGAEYIKTLRSLLRDLPKEDYTHQPKKYIHRLALLGEKLLGVQDAPEKLQLLLEKDVIQKIAYSDTPPECLFMMVDFGKNLIKDNWRETRDFLFRNGSTLLKSQQDVEYYESLIGRFGNKADGIIRGYAECVTAGVITHEDRQLVDEFLKEFRILSPKIIENYKTSKAEGHEEIFVMQLRAIAEKLTGAEIPNDIDRNSPYYFDLLRYVYPNNAGNFALRHGETVCKDRQQDLEPFVVQPRYDMDLLSQGSITVRSGEQIDQRAIDRAQQPILKISEDLQKVNMDPEAFQKKITEQVKESLITLQQKGRIASLDIAPLTPDEALFVLLAESTLGQASLDSELVKNLTLSYQFAFHEDIHDYMAGTRDRVAQASNQEYALLCELNTFYNDRIKETNRLLAQRALDNPVIAGLLPQYFREISQAKQSRKQSERLHRLQLEKLGLSESFLQQVRETLIRRSQKRFSDDEVRAYVKDHGSDDPAIASLLSQQKNDSSQQDDISDALPDIPKKTLKQLSRILEKRTGRTYTIDEAKAIVTRYERMFLREDFDSETTQKEGTKAFVGQLQNQRERSFEAVQILSDGAIDTSRLTLGEINFDELLHVEKAFQEGTYDQEQFAGYAVQQFIDLFSDEQMVIDQELAKYVSESGKSREVLYGYIAKTQETAHARMVGGVCVSADNPKQSGTPNLWEMSNYLQLVLQDPDTLRCQGLVLMHHFTDEHGKRILTASLNPSSTYLYSVDEVGLFNALLGTLETFAKENAFDMIAVSTNHSIRTNRTGGLFERTLDDRIREVGMIYEFDTAKQFSYNPAYVMKDMDVIWHT
jgi:hypothetical protein